MSDLLPMPHLVTCSRKKGREVTHIGGGTAGQPWFISVEAAIQGMESGTWAFYVVVGDQVGPLQVVRKPDGEKFLTGAMDSAEPNSLLNLPECPPGWGRLW
jgi:Protein of unknown function (DUF3892)